MQPTFCRFAAMNCWLYFIVLFFARKHSQKKRSRWRHKTPLFAQKRPAVLLGSFG